MGEHCIVLLRCCCMDGALDMVDLHRIRID